MVKNPPKQPSLSIIRFCSFRLIIKKIYQFYDGYILFICEFYLPMQSVRLFDNQLVTNLWFKYGSNFSKFFRTLEIE